MFRHLVESVGITQEKFATLLGVDQSMFNQWLSGQRPIPESFKQILSTIIGVQSSRIQSGRRESSDELLLEDSPAIWYKFRGNELKETDREFVFVIRQLAHYINELEEATQERSTMWKPLFESIRRDVDNQASPVEQGRQAAKMFREATGLEHGSGGIGSIIRENLRSNGILVVESPLVDSRIEGFSFYVGSVVTDRPCIFANSHGSTWFRRNVVLMHETAHAIFDAEHEGATLDFADTSTEVQDLKEKRAEAFARETMVPKSVLNHIAQARGIKWETLSAHDLAVLVANVEVEKKTILEAAANEKLLPQGRQVDFLKHDISSILPELTDRALTTEQYIEKIGAESARDWLNKRSTTIPVGRPLRLPVPYIVSILKACNNYQISLSKAARMLMIDQKTFFARFEEDIKSVA